MDCLDFDQHNKDSAETKNVDFVKQIPSNQGGSTPKRRTSPVTVVAVRKKSHDGDVPTGFCE